MELQIDAHVSRLQQKHLSLVKKRTATDAEFVSLEAEFQRVLNLYPEHPGLLYTLGNLHAQSDRSGAAITYFSRALEFGADKASVLINMAVAYKNEHKDASASDCYGKAMAILEAAERKNAKRLKQGRELVVDPAWVRENLTLVHHGMASLYVNTGQPEKIIAWADKALALDQNDRFALWNKALGLLESGRFAEGFRLYDEAGFMQGGLKPEERKLKTYGGLPKWDGTPGQTVICYGEQGVGDEIMFASMLPDLMRDCRVIIDCDKRLEKLFRRSFPDAEAIYPTSDAGAAFPWLADHKVDAWVPMGSLGRYYRPDVASFPRTPFLKPDPALVAEWRDYMDANHRGLRVGISWKGGLRKTRFDMRSIPLAAWGDILKVPGVEWFSLQYHSDAAHETADVGNKTGVPIHHWADMIGSYEETSGFLSSLDLVISVNTSLVHLAGSLGSKTWCLTPKMVAWRYGCTGPNPFYGSVEMFRQAEATKWLPVLGDVRDRLAALTMREAA